MNAEMVARTIQLVLAPAIMMVVCAHMLVGLLGRYGVTHERLRALAHERLLLAQGAGAAPDEHLAEFEAQLPDLLRRHKRLRDAILAVDCAVMLFVMTMVVIGVASVYNSAEIAALALLIFLAGLAALLAGVFLTTLEIRGSHHAIEAEVRRVEKLRG